jgi:hypothetical protein
MAGIGDEGCTQARFIGIFLKMQGDKSMVTVKANRKTGTFKMPLLYRAMLRKGDRFLFSQSGDTIMLKQIQERVWPADMPSSKPPMSLEEISREVRAVRRKSAGKSR